MARFTSQGFWFDTYWTHWQIILYLTSMNPFLYLSLFHMDLKHIIKTRDVFFISVVTSSVLRPILISCVKIKKSLTCKFCNNRMYIRNLHMVHFMLYILACLQMLIVIMCLLRCIKHFLPSFHSRHGLHIFPPVADLHCLFLQRDTQMHHSIVLKKRSE